MRAGRAGALLGLGLALGCATPAPPEPFAATLRAGCAWESRWDDGGGRREARAAACLERLDVGTAWSPGPGARPGDPGHCAEAAWRGVERFRRCMAASGWREQPAGRVPYARVGAGPEAAALAARRCAESSFHGTRYGRFAAELEWCLLRRGWQRAR